jgi:uncharacterized BrkB/YihY/UPF0761 family membrane protein
MLGWMPRTLAQSRPVRVVLTALRRFTADDADTHAAALAYQLFLSTLALSIAALAVLGMVADRVSIEVPEGAEEQWQNLTDGGLVLGLVALGGILWTSSTFGRRASHAFAMVFRTGQPGMVRERLQGLIVALGVIVLVGALPIVTAILATLRADGVLETPVRVLGFTATVAVELALFLAAYVTLTPHGGPKWRAHVPGALLMTAGWEVFKVAGGLLLAYLVRKSTLLYGAIGSVVGLLVLLRIATWLFLFGAELSATLQERSEPDPR